jgi:hypothetical protein
MVLFILTTILKIPPNLPLRKGGTNIQVGLSNKMINPSQPPFIKGRCKNQVADFCKREE